MGKLTRRDFTKIATAASVSTALGSGRVLGANDRVRLGFIALGNRGDQVLDGFLAHKDAEVVAICDIHQPYMDFAAKKIGGGPRQFKDYRKLLEMKDVDAVVINTPDHWHALQMIHACQADKDVYVEKPLSLTVVEGRRMVEAAESHKRVVQVGLQRRSSEFCREAAEFIRGGGIGKVTAVRAFHIQNEWPKGIGKPPDEAPPAGFDWDAWLGPAPKVPYNKNRTFYRFRWFYHYSGGQLTNMGVHYLDLIQWALGHDAPAAVTAMGGNFAVEDNRDIPDTLEVIWRYPGGTLVTFTQINASAPLASARDCDVEFRGTKGALYLMGNGYEVVPDEITPNEFPVRTPLDRAVQRGWRAGQRPMIEARKVAGRRENADHARNFLDCVRSRERCRCDIETGHRRGPLDNSPAAPIGQELAALLLGIPGGSMARNASYATQDKYFALYLHDDFKIHRNLTLNLGLRYELETPFTERFDRLVAGFAFDQTNPLEAAAKANYAKNPIAELPVSQFIARGGLNFANQNGNGRSPYPGEKNNFLPRIGLAWQINGKTVLRAGYGVYFDTLGVNTTLPIQTGFAQSTPIQASLDNGQTYIATLADPLPNGLLSPLGPGGGLLTNVGQSIDFFDPNMKHPYSQRWSLGVQRELPFGFVAEVSYVGNRGARIPVRRNYNNTPAQYLSKSPTRDQATIDFLSRTGPNPFFGLNPIFGRNISRANLLKPFPHFGDIEVEEPIGYSWYHSLQNRIEKRFSQGYTFQLAYTWSKLMEAVEFLNPADPTPYESIGGQDRTHRIAASGILEIPVGRGKRFGADWPGLVNFFIGGWQIGGVVTIQSGPPLGFGNAIYFGDLKDLALPKDRRRVEGWFNTAGFVALRDAGKQGSPVVLVNGQPVWVDFNDPCKTRPACAKPLSAPTGFNRDAAFQLGSNIRTMPLRFGGLRGDSQQRWDFSLTKTWPITERFKAQLRAEVFNAWNQTNLNAPNTSPTSSAFGTITGTAGDARAWQFWPFKNDA